MPAFVTLAMQVLPLLIQAGMDIMPFVNKLIDSVNRPDGPTQADWDYLHTEEARLRGLLNNPKT